MEQAIPILPIDDMAAARTFYVDGLGFDIEFESLDEKGQGLIGVARGSIRLTLDCPMPGHGRGAAVGVEVEDADRYFEEWAARVTVDAPPKNEDWGARTFSVHDPSGNTIFVMGPIPEVPG